MANLLTKTNKQKTNKQTKHLGSSKKAKTERFYSFYFVSYSRIQRGYRLKSKRFFIFVTSKLLKSYKTLKQNKRTCTTMRPV